MTSNALGDISLQIGSRRRGKSGEPTVSAAAEQFEQALRLQPRHPEVLDHLAMARLTEQRYEAR